MSRPKAFIFGTGQMSKKILPSAEQKYEINSDFDTVTILLGNTLMNKAEDSCMTVWQAQDGATGPACWWWMGNKVLPIIRPWVTGKDVHTQLDVEFSRAWVRIEQGSTGKLMVQTLAKRG